MIEYSEKEQRLFHALHFGDFLTQEPSLAYKTLGYHCFTHNLAGPLVESVRRCCNAMSNCNPYRLTGKFDALIVLPEDLEEPK
jgi:hypothetical protein